MRSCKRLSRRAIRSRAPSAVPRRARPRGRSSRDLKNKSIGGRMALLIVELDKRIGNAKEWRDVFRQQIPDLPIRIWPDAGEVKDIEYLAFMHPDFDALPAFPNLKAMFSRSAGVESFARHP